ncbi:thioredoxin TrxC [Methylobacter sp.]|uniref:thioredoxin TrxC n=1 Tax=Methylobacter sp. TaxID=2051955 RepID=UPI002489C1AB|nr:thioredoxin TrxC [Methylobacter sp.]MDI1278166.1 thioredoxin TrxC [Methylobacter sp.]MDI1358909.1 thioredoxin TrxC [Methylobacter sp.]
MSTLHIVCPHCHTVNRIASERLTQHPRCGQCKAALFTGHPLELTGRNFQQHIARNDIPVVVDFWASWCGPSKMMAPAYAQAALTLEPKVRLVKLNTEQEQDIAAQFNIRSIPTLVIFKSGREIARMSGAMSAADIVRWVNSHI